MQGTKRARIFLMSVPVAMILIMVTRPLYAPLIDVFGDDMYDEDTVSGMDTGADVNPAGEREGRKPAVFFFFSFFQTPLTPHSPLFLHDWIGLTITAGTIFIFCVTTALYATVSMDMGLVQKHWPLVHGKKHHGKGISRIAGGGKKSSHHRHDHDQGGRGGDTMIKHGGGGGGRKESHHHHHHRRSLLLLHHHHDHHQEEEEEAHEGRGVDDGGWTMTRTNEGMAAPTG